MFQDGNLSNESVVITMLRTTFLLELIAVLTLLAVIKEGYFQMIVPKVQNLRCRGQPCKDRVVCTFNQLGKEPPEGYNLTLNNMETIRCQRADDNPNNKQCSLEDLKEEQEFGFSPKIELSLISSLIIPELNTDVYRQLTVDYTGCRLPQHHPVIKGFSYDPIKKELHIYWNVWVFASNDTETYAVFKKGKPLISSHKASIVGRNFAIFRDWNPELPANVTLWILNLQERTQTTRYLKVPILTNADQRQPQKVWYDDSTTTIYSDEPIEKNTLDGYTLYWCLKSSTSCDDWEDMQSWSVKEYQNQFQFGSSMARYHMAVEANYTDGNSGGMKWIVPPTKHDDFDFNNMLTITGSGMVIIAILFVLGVIIFKKLRHNQVISDIYSAPSNRESYSPGGTVVDKEEEASGVIIEQYYLTIKPIPRDSTSKEETYVPHVPHFPPPPCPVSSTVDDEAIYTEVF